jgi:uncharacterized protein (DUF433 family)
MDQAQPPSGRHEPLPGVILVDPERLQGTPVFVGTRVPVSYLFEYLAAGDSVNEFLRQYPGVRPDQVSAVLAAAKDRLLERGRAA